MSSLTSPAPSPQRPWYREPMVWLVVGGPLTVVVAGILTAVIAIRGADVVLTEQNAGQAKVGQPDAMTPAVQARNHAQTAQP